MTFHRVRVSLLVICFLTLPLMAHTACSRMREPSDRDTDESTSDSPPSSQGDHPSKVFVREKRNATEMSHQEWEMLPYVAAIVTFYRRPSLPLKPGPMPYTDTRECTGSILEGCYVLTLAECLQLKTSEGEVSQYIALQVFAGFQDDCQFDVIELKVSKVITYIEVDGAREIALIKLDSPLACTKDGPIRAFKLPVDSLFSVSTENGGKTMQTTFERSDSPESTWNQRFPRIVSVPSLLRPDEWCRKVDHDHDYSEVCALIDAPDGLQCSKTLGGPLSLEVHGTQYLIGVTFHGIGGFCDRFSIMFSHNVLLYKPWILRDITDFP